MSYRLRQVGLLGADVTAKAMQVIQPADETMHPVYPRVSTPDSQQQSSGTLAPGGPERPVGNFGALGWGCGVAVEDAALA